MPAAFFGHDGVRREMRAQPLDDQLLGGAVGFRHQVVLAFQLEADVLLEDTSRAAHRLRGRSPRWSLDKKA